MAQGIRITVYAGRDQGGSGPFSRGQSVSMTIPHSPVIGPGLEEVAQYTQQRLAERWPQVTKLNSRRHKRR